MFCCFVYKVYYVLFKDINILKVVLKIYIRVGVDVGDRRVRVVVDKCFYVWFWIC